MSTVIWPTGRKKQQFQWELFDKMGGSEEGAAMGEKISEKKRFITELFNKIFLPGFFLTASVFLGGCAEEGTRGEGGDYDRNLFFTAQPSAPSREKKVNIDFFNKECSPSGNTTLHGGKEYECHYTSD